MKKTKNQKSFCKLSIGQRIIVLALLFMGFVFNLNAQSPQGTHGTIYCNTADQILYAMANAEPGDEIIIATGTYTATKKTEAPDNRGKWARYVGMGDGNSSDPIIVRGASSSSRPILQGPVGDYNGYTMRIFGDYWIIKDLVITEGSKGLVLDRSSYCEINNVLVHNIGDEGIHLRDGSSNNLVDNCEIFNSGVIQPNYGEGFYIGSDKGQHTTDPNSTDYNPYCFDNTIQNCKVGPNVSAEGADIKEGTKNIIIRDCEFSADGISGENSADAFIDLKGVYAFIYNNTFNVDGSSILAAGIDILDRGTDDNTGYRNAIFNNVYNMGSGNDDIPGVRFKQGDPLETHYWDNTRVPDSPEPVNYYSDEITYECPSWNIVSCDGGELTNRAPSVSIASPDYNDVFVTGSNITFTANATDSDGTVTKVEFYLDGTKIGEDDSEVYNYTKNNVANGTYTVTAKATDNEGATTTSTGVNFTVEDAVSIESPYAYGIVPANANASDAEAAYATFIDKFYEDCGDGKGRIRWGLSANSWESPDETVSEGIAYGMILAAYFNDQTHFDGLWNYYKAFPNGNGFMHWHTEGCNTVLEQNGATDSDQDAAMALIIADKVFGSSGSVDYANDAKDMIALIKQYEVESGTYVLKPGDAFGGSDVTNISYFATGTYKLFGQFTNDEAFWNSVVDKCYVIIDNNLDENNAVGGLVSDWCKADGTEASGKSLNYSYDASRTPWRIATDYIWFGDTRAKSYLDKTNNFVQNTINGIQNVKDGYQQNGDLIAGDRYHNNTFVSNFACAGVTLTLQAEFDTYYEEIVATPPVGYFDYLFDVFARTMMSGIYTNPLEGGVTIVPVTGVSMSQTTATLVEGATLDLNATIAPSNASNKSVSWTSSNTSVATVNSSGLVTAVNAGSTVITVTTDDGDKTATCNVTVTPTPTDQTPYPSGVPHAIPGTIASINYDNGGQNVAYYDASAGNAGSGPRQDEDVDLGTNNIGWISTGEWVEYTVNVEAGTYDIDVDVASATANGKFHIEFGGVDKTGVQTVNNTGAWGTYYTITISDVNLSGGQQVMRVYMDGSSFNLEDISFTKQTGTVDPITVESVDAEQSPNVAENLFDGNTDDASRWSANGFPKSVVIDYGETKSITGTKVWTYQDRSYHYTIGISSSPASGFATVVDQSGTAPTQPIKHSFTATSGRYLELTVTGATDYTGDWVSITELEIVEGEATTVPVTAVSLSPSSVSLLVGETQSLLVTVSPSDATNQTVSYSSNNTTVATVNSSGVISAVSAGSATITVTTADGSKTDNCAVNVTIDDGGTSCNYEPMASALPTLNTDYSNIFVSDNGPDLSNIRKFSINWNLTNNGLYTFAFNTENGSPDWYVNMLGAVSHNLNSSQPELSVSGSGFSGFDGDYYAIMDGNNFVLAEKSGSYSIYFSTSSTAPDCDSFKSASGIENSELSAVSIYPNPVSQDYLNIAGLDEANVQVIVSDILGKTMLIENVNSDMNQIDVSMLKAGTYILIIKGESKRTSKFFNKL
ncbi:MAG: glycosyl hydrolase family 8 [Salinivirgaceae bacterium]|jgi:parallel beta-helix repeat protein|nr:glycosyl hydrolase family 8 [Salinivirgaceae bacterium]